MVFIVGIKLRKINILLLFFIAAVMFLLPDSLHAKAKNTNTTTPEFSNEPALIEADSLSYDFEKSLVIASGNVEITQGKRQLIADTLTYDKINNIVTAKGNVSLVDTSGNVLFAEEVELKDDLKKGVVNNFSISFTDKSKMAAKSGERINENTIIIRKAVYSPCPVCKEKPEKAPLWQVAASKATVNNDKQRVSYKNAFFEVYGIPVLYTPYFSHPTPDADRKSGFLTPKYKHDRIFGTMIQAPYYYNIAPNKDATITPILTTNEGIIMAGEYRHLLENGKYILKGSITNPDEVDASGNKIHGKNVRGHVEGEGEFSINQYWDWGFAAKRSSDDTYLKKYSFGEEDVLTSKLYATRIENRDHVLVEAISFQGLKATDDPGKTPLILPYVQTHTERRIAEYGATAYLDTNLLDLTRSEGVSSRRISLKSGLEKTYIAPSGNIFTSNASIRGDGYSVEDVPDPNNSNNHLNGTEGRFIPEASMKWSLPLLKQAPERQYLLEPITKFIISPNGGNPAKIPNEDSQDIEFSAMNLFDSNHFYGYDKIESGTRMNYGLRGGINDYNYGDITFLLGQSYRATDNHDFTPQSGLYDNFSDYVGKIDYNKDNMFDLAYQFRFDKDTLAIRNNTISTGVNFSPVHFTLDYVVINEDAVTANPFSSSNLGDDREIIIAGTKIEINDRLEFISNGNRNLATGEWVSTKGGFIYKGSCVDFSIELLKEFTHDRDIQPGTSISFQVSLKNMGQKRIQQ